MAKAEEKLPVVPFPAPDPSPIQEAVIPAQAARKVWAIPVTRDVRYPGHHSREAVNIPAGGYLVVGVDGYVDYYSESEWKEVNK